MKDLAEYKEEIHSCSKCGLCQSVCPIYKITGNDCSVSRGHFIMLKGLIKGDLKMTKKLNRYLDLCLKCGACSKFCPSDIDVVEIIASAKAEYFKSHPTEKLISLIQRTFISFLHLIPWTNTKSQKFDKKVIFFSGCKGGRGKWRGKWRGKCGLTKLLNSCSIEVIEPKFNCCGIPFYVRGDRETYEKYKQSFIDTIKKYDIKEVVTTCASCEKTLKGYNIEGLEVKNIYHYLRENQLKLKLKKPVKVTFHKPCNIENFEDIKWILENTENLEYIEMKDFDSCCGLNGITKFKEYSVMSKLFKNKRKNIIDTKTKIVLTSCLGCEVALSLYSLFKYKTFDLIEFLNQNIKKS